MSETKQFETEAKALLENAQLTRDDVIDFYHKWGQQIYHKTSFPQPGTDHTRFDLPFLISMILRATGDIMNTIKVAVWDASQVPTRQGTFGPVPIRGISKLSFPFTVTVEYTDNDGKNRIKTIKVGAAINEINSPSAKVSVNLEAVVDPERPMTFTFKLRGEKIHETEIRWWDLKSAHNLRTSDGHRADIHSSKVKPAKGQKPTHHRKVEKVELYFECAQLLEELAKFEATRDQASNCVKQYNECGGLLFNKKRKREELEKQVVDIAAQIETLKHDESEIEKKRQKLSEDYSNICFN